MSHEPCIVLVVDDNRDCADSAAIVLGLYGHETHTAYSPQEALAKAKAIQPHVTLMDIGLPGKSGIDLAKEVKEICPSCRIIALTGFTDQHVRDAWHANGLNGVLHKPTEPKEMNDVVSQECNEAKCH